APEQARSSRQVERALESRMTPLQPVERGICGQERAAPQQLAAAVLEQQQDLLDAHVAFAESWHEVQRARVAVDHAPVPGQLDRARPSREPPDPRGRMEADFERRREPEREAAAGENLQRIARPGARGATFAIV